MQCAMPGSTAFRSGQPLQKSPFTQHRRSLRAGAARCAVVEQGDSVLVCGATGGVGQLVTAKLLERGYRVRALVRNREKAAELLGERPDLQIVTADLRNQRGLDEVVSGVDAIAWALGTTAFPSARWKGDNGPEQTDLVSFRNLLQVIPRGIKRVIFTSSCGVERQSNFPFSILNLFGVLKYKRQAEQLLEASGLPYALLRPGRLTDGPYTSYDLNTLLQATSGSRQDVTLSLEDDQTGEASRIAVAEAVVQLLGADGVENKAFSVISQEGEGPGQDSEAWARLFAQAR